MLRSLLDIRLLSSKYIWVSGARMVVGGISVKYIYLKVSVVLSKLVKT